MRRERWRRGKDVRCCWHLLSTVPTGLPHARTQIRMRALVRDGGYASVYVHNACMAFGFGVAVATHSRSIIVFHRADETAGGEARFSNYMHTRTQARNVRMHRYARIHTHTHTNGKKGC